VAGELYIGGEGVARGYLNNPELTAERFVSPPSSPSSPSLPSSHFYHTGDLARWLPDGTVEFLGRVDQQVKIRGFRIELGEIEARIAEHPAIKETVVIDREGRGGEKFLCAYVVPAGEIAAKELEDYLSRLLPVYMVPSYFVRLESIPLNANGKLDRRALPAPEAGETETYTTPSSHMEKALAAIWSEVLGIEVEALSVESDFFRLGGHSLKATVMVSKVHKELGVRVPLAEVVVYPTIRKLAGYISALSLEQFVSIPLVEDREYYPLS
ncbi:MAG: AMP-binding protein, partial [Herbaspirillum sp.]|uniref:phosphopantetheine-binding protein n=1 Tax=Herbaspirillum sp. TaxID=1890675 RepID=UPI00258F04B5